MVFLKERKKKKARAREPPPYHELIGPAEGKPSWYSQPQRICHFLRSVRLVTVADPSSLELLVTKAVLGAAFDDVVGKLLDVSDLPSPPKRELSKQLENQQRML